MFKAVIVDDEEDIRYLIRYLVEKSKHSREIGRASCRERV